MHGKTSLIRHDGAGLFKDLPPLFEAMRYHSLVADAASLPNALKATAHSSDDNEIMALEHAGAPVAGVQFHPESIATEHGLAIFRNFLDWSRPQ
jgi:anthranilate synthase component 2